MTILQTASLQMSTFHVIFYSEMVFWMTQHNAVGDYTCTMHNIAFPRVSKSRADACNFMKLLRQENPRSVEVLPCFKQVCQPHLA